MEEREGPCNLRWGLALCIFGARRFFWSRRVFFWAGVAEKKRQPSRNKVLFAQVARPGSGITGRGFVAEMNWGNLSNKERHKGGSRKTAAAIRRYRTHRDHSSIA